MPVMSVKAKARIAAMLIAVMFTVITPLPLQRCLEQESGEKLCPASHQRLREKWNYSRPQVAKRNANQLVPTSYLMADVISTSYCNYLLFCRVALDAM